MEYRIRAYRIGELVLRGNHAFDGGDPDQPVPYAMFVWLITGGERPILVDTGPKSIEEINRGLGDMCIEPVTQREGEDILAIMARAHVDPAEVGHVFFTHMHYDHVTNIDLFPSARIVADRAGYEEALRRLERGLCWVPGEVIFPMRDQWQDRLELVRDHEVLPGIRAFHVGGHTPCSMAISVRTRAGRAVITGDVASLYENIERDVPIGVYENRDEVMAAMRRIRAEADIVLPSHDPKVLERFPRGAIG
jgi:N-acyl homoserine lactone hydrolase